MGPKEKKAPKQKSPRKMPSKKAKKTPVSGEVTSNVHRNPPSEDGIGSKVSQKQPEVVVEGDHVMGEIENFEEQDEKSHSSKKGNDDAPILDEMTGIEFRGSLKEQLMKVTSKNFTVDADVVVNTETNRFTEPGSGKNRSNVRSFRNG